VIKERGLLNLCAVAFKARNICPFLLTEISELLAQPEQSEQEPVTDKPTETAMAIMPNGVCVSNVYDAYEEGRKSVMVEQEPVAWMQDSIELYVLEEKSAIRGYVIPLYTAPPTREPLSEKEIREGNQSMLNATRETFIAGVRFAEVMHGIGVDDE
jgi:hypothetical protein